MSGIDPSIDGPTPEHLRWTLARACPLRELSDVESPEETERLLRAAREFSLARAEGRVVPVDGDLVAISASSLVDGVTIDAARGFAADAALAPCGGWELVEATCRGCPANVGEQACGCFGLVAAPVEETTRREFRGQANRLAFAMSFFSSDAWSDAWRRWNESPEQRRRIVSFLSALASNVDGSLHRSLATFAAAARRALADQDLRLVVTHHPAGRIEGRTWTTVAHCDACKSAWPDARKRECDVCGAVGGRQPERRRKKIGTRPWRRLLEFLSREEAERILQRAKPQT